MAPNSAFRERTDAAENTDPREGQGAEIIDLATRNVLPRVTQRKKADGFGMVAGVLIVAALGGVTLWSMDAARNGPAEAPPAPAPAAPVPGSPVVAPPPVNAAQPQPAPLSAPAPQPVLAAPPQVQSALAPASNPFASPTVVFDIGGTPVAVAVPGAAADGKAVAGSNDEFASRVGGVGGTGSAMASRSFDPATTVTQGTLIPAVLETAIDTDVPGYVRAIVSTDVRSFDGKRVLVPRSSRLIGQYKSGLSAGQKRAYVIWTRLIRPDGASVNIASPAIAFGGETGLPGKVNSHFFERFGSAMLLSVVGGLSSLVGNSGSSVIVAGSGQSAAAAAVQQGGTVGPTIRVRQGEPIRVFTAKDLDFSKVS